nr:hypothetical protein [Pontimonas sp.]
MIPGAFLVVLLVLLPPIPDAIWEWPTEGDQKVLRDFRAPSTPWGPGHRGLDLAASGANIVAPATGVVSFKRAGRHPRRADPSNPRGNPHQHGTGGVSGQAG